MNLYGAATGTDTYSLSISVPATFQGLKPGDEVKASFANANTGAATLSVNGGAAVPIILGSAALAASAILAGPVYTLMFDGASFVLAAGLSSLVIGGALHGGTTGGVADVYTLTPLPAITAYAAKQTFLVKFHAANTGAATIAVSGLAAKSLKYKGANPAADLIDANAWMTIMYDGTNFEIIAGA